MATRRRKTRNSEPVEIQRLPYPKVGAEFSLSTAESLAINGLTQQKQQAEAGLSQVCAELCQRLGIHPRTNFELKGNKVVVLPEKNPEKSVSTPSAPMS